MIEIKKNSLGTDMILQCNMSHYCYYSASMKMLHVDYKL